MNNASLDPSFSTRLLSTDDQRLQSPDIGPGPESREVRLFSWDQIPWNDIAFPSVRWALEHFRDTSNESAFMPRSRSDAD